VKVYISGPIAGRVDGNRLAFRAAARRLREAGYEPVDPHEVSHEHVGSTWGPHASFLHCFGRDTGREGDPHRYGCYLLTDLAAMADCEAVLVLTDWQQSPGARVEVAFAEACGIPVWHVVP
jgi:hypothetical protein